MKKAKTLADELATLPLPRGQWFQSLPEDARDELRDVRQRFHSGGYAAPIYSLATALIQLSRKRGWSMPSQKVLVTWLRNND